MSKCIKILIIRISPKIVENFLINYYEKNFIALNKDDKIKKSENQLNRVNKKNKI